MDFGDGGQGRGEGHDHSDGTPSDGTPSDGTPSAFGRGHSHGHVPLTLLARCTYIYARACLPLAVMCIYIYTHTRAYRSPRSTYMCMYIYIYTCSVDKRLPR